jgi:ectoine hydroxylase-related dioxygenase (phytanoyl-CoA dioxygenase family)
MGAGEPAEAAERIRSVGHTVLERVLAPGPVAALAAAVRRCMEAAEVPFGTGEFLGRRTRRLFNLLARDPIFAGLPVHPGVLPVVEKVLGPECLLSSLTGIEMHPGETDQPLHADDGSIPLPKPHLPITCTVLLALSDFTRENGATRVVPGSHQSDHSPGRAERSVPAEAVVMPAGSALVIHGSLWHGGGANQSAAARLAIVCNYCAGWIRQEECQLLAIPREQVVAFPRRLQALVGYGTYRGLLGHVDQVSPAEWVDPGARTDMVWGRIRR